jgi:hypothetical protein
MINIYFGICACVFPARAAAVSNCSGCGLDHFCHAGVLTCRIDFHTVDAPECSTSSANSSSKAHQPSAVSRLAASIKARLAGSFSAALGGESPVSLEDDDTGRQMIEAAKVGQIRQEIKDGMLACVRHRDMSMLCMLLSANCRNFSCPAGLSYSSRVVSLPSLDLCLPSLDLCLKSWSVPETATEVFAV